MRFLPILAVAATLAGCDAGGMQGPSLDLEDLPATVKLALGEQRQVGTAIVRFEAVPGDSRCPIDVVCVWEGNAELEIVVEPAFGRGPAHLLRLNTALEPRTGSAWGLVLSVVGLEPARVSTRPPRDYRVELRIEDAAQ